MCWEYNIKIFIMDFYLICHKHLDSAMKDIIVL